MDRLISLKVPLKCFGQFVFLGCFLFELLLFYLCGIEQLHVDILKYELLIIYSYILFQAFTKKGPFSLYTIFLYTIFIFLYGRVLFDLLGEWDLSYVNIFLHYYFSIESQFEILSLLILSLLLIHLGSLYSFDDISEQDIPFKYESWPALQQWALLFFILSLPATVYKYWIELQIILSNGYLAVFDGTLDNIEFPFWTAGSGTVLICSYAVFISSRPEKRPFLIVSFTFFLLNIFNTLKGSRSKMFVPLLFLLWLYFTFYKSNPKVSLWKLLLLVVLSIVFSQWMTAFRSDSAAFETSELFILFFLQQGISILVLGTLVNFKGMFVNNGYPYILAPLFTWGFGHGQTFETLQSTHFLGNELTHFLSPESYYAGRGLGSSFIAEFYDAGIIPFIILSFFTGYFISHFVKYVKNSRLMFVLAFFIVQNIIFMPRANFLPNLSELVVGLIFYFLLSWLAKQTGVVHLKLIK